MHGIIFAALQEYTRDRLGDRQSREIFGGRYYTMAETHPDDELTRLLERAAEAAGLTMPELLREFGAFTAKTVFARLYPAFYEIAGGTRPFLLTVEDRIHELVRATIPNAAPPALSVRARDEEVIEIEYASPRRLCRLLEGLVLGTGDRYGENVQIEEVVCVHDGAAACRFEVRVGG